MIKVIVWNEFQHEKTDEECKAIYPDGMHAVIAGFLNTNEDITASMASLDEIEHGLTVEALADCDVLIWWGHAAHERVQDEIVERVYKRVIDGMGLIVLHSGHGSKIFGKLCGTNAGHLSWREVKELERIFFIDPAHPIAKGLPEYFEIKQTEMYGEYFCIPTPDELIGISWFAGGEVFRSIFTLKKGFGRVVYLRPGHETFPIFKQAEIQTLITNSVRYANCEIIPKITYRSNIALPKL